MVEKNCETTTSATSINSMKKVKNFAVYGVPETWYHVAYDVSEKEIDEIWDSHDNPQVVAASCGCKLWLQVRSGLKNMHVVVNRDRSK